MSRPGAVPLSAGSEPAGTDRGLANADVIDPGEAFPGRIVLTVPHMDDCVLACSGIYLLLKKDRAPSMIPFELTSSLPRFAPEPTQPG